MDLQEFHEALKNDKEIEQLEYELEKIIDFFDDITNGNINITQKSAKLHAENGRKIKSRLDYLKEYKKIKGWD